MATNSEIFDEFKSIAKSIALHKYHRIGGHFSEVDSDDLVQEAYIALWKAIESFDESRGASIRTWIYSTIDRRLIDFTRTQDHVSRSYRKELGSERLKVQFFPEHEKGEGLRESNIVSPDTDPESSVINQEVRDVIFRYRTKEKNRMILIEYYFIEMTMKEIAIKWSISEGRISQIVSKELTKLRDFYQGINNDTRRNRKKGQATARNEEPKNRLHLVENNRRSLEATSVQW